MDGLANWLEKLGDHSKYGMIGVLASPFVSPLLILMNTGKISFDDLRPVNIFAFCLTIPLSFIGGALVASRATRTKYLWAILGGLFGGAFFVLLFFAFLEAIGWVWT